MGATALCVVGFGSVLAACGNDSDSSSTGSTSNGTSGGFEAYLSCLNKNGVNIQIPTGGFPSGAPGGAFPSGAPAGARPSGMPGGGTLQKPTDVDDDTWQKAQNACASARPSMGTAAAADNGAMRAYLNCLSNHGVSASAAPEALNTADPKVAEAQRACAALRPDAAPSGN